MARDILKISVENLNKSFDIEGKKYHVLNNLSFDINHGERIGLIGENGAGKTTLLNIICGFLQYDSGIVNIKGKVNALMSLGIGLKEELTGRENIYIDGELHNISRSEVEKYIEGIISFADIGEYIDNPVKIYSSGMKARLSFAMATMIEPEILIIDEVLGVGDANFALKALKRVEELCNKGKILIVVSHSMDTIKQLTNRTIWLKDGKIQNDDITDVVIKAYRDFIHKKEEDALLKQFELRQKDYYIESNIKIVQFNLLCNGKEKSLFYIGERLQIFICMVSNQRLHDIDIKISLLRMDGTLLIENYYSKDNDRYIDILSNQTLKYNIDFGILKFSEGTFEILCELIDKNKNKLAQNFAVLQLINNQYKYSSKPQYFCDYSVRVIN